VSETRKLPPPFSTANLMASGFAPVATQNRLNEANSGGSAS
jgi:hypothetical protein